MIIGTIKSHLCKPFVNTTRIQDIKNEVYQSELQGLLDRLKSDLDSNSKQLLKLISESLMCFTVGPTSFFDLATVVNDRIIGPPSIESQLPFLFDAVVACELILTFDSDRPDSNILTKKDFNLDNSPATDPPDVISEKTKLLSIWND